MGDTNTRSTGVPCLEGRGENARRFHIALDVIDTLFAEIMRGFGAVPKRGAEKWAACCWGRSKPGFPTIVRIEDFGRPVECGYTRGPSYLFSEEERARFDAARERWRKDAPRPESSVECYAVGYCRSHTRDGMSLAPEDVELMDRYLSTDPSNVALLMKPFVTKAGPVPDSFFARTPAPFRRRPPWSFPSAAAI